MPLQPLLNKFYLLSISCTVKVLFTEILSLRTFFSKAMINLMSRF
jgi:hypothetical protein